MTRAARIAAAGIALIALVALLVRFSVSWHEVGTAGGALWGMLRFFTIIGNVLLMIVMTGVAANLRFATHPRILGGITLFLMLIGVVYVLLLSDRTLTGAAALANILLHYVTTVVTPLFWLVFAPKGGLRLSDPPRWALLPIAYVPYALARAAQDGKYPYPFLNLDRLGWDGMLVNVAGIALGFMIVGYVLVMLDRLFARRR